MIKCLTCDYSFDDTEKGRKFLSEEQNTWSDCCPKCFNSNLAYNDLNDGRQTWAIDIDVYGNLIEKEKVIEENIIYDIQENLQEDIIEQENDDIINETIENENPED